MNEEWIRRLEALENEKGVLDTLHRCALASDYGSDEEWLDLFVSDAVLEIVCDSAIRDRLAGRGGTNYDRGVRFSGVRQLATFIAGRKQAPGWRCHHATIRPLVEIEGEEASAVSYYIGISFDQGRYDVFAAGRYFDRLTRSEDGRWRFVKRVIAAAGM
jgi:hypothetical protein